MSTAQLSQFDVEDRILESLKRRDGVATAGDVAADTGLGYGDVENALRRMLSLYKSHLDVDDDGNLRYRFDKGFVRRGEDPARLWHDIKHALWTGFKWFFKVWIMVTLVGYTVVFLLLLVGLVVAENSAGNNRRSGGGFSLFLLARVLEWLFWIDLYSGRGGAFGSSYSRRRRRPRKKPDKAFYQKVFDYVFGPEPKTDALKAQTAFTAFVRELNGRVTAADWSARTGQTLPDAENALTAAIVRFNGDVDVTDDGQLVYRFDDLMVTAGKNVRGKAPHKIWTRKKQPPKFTGNKTSSNVWISIFNTFNLAMSSVVMLVVTQPPPPGQPPFPPGIFWGLGVVPFFFSLVFFAVPLIRSLGYFRKKSKVARENLRRQEIQKIYGSVQGAQAEPIKLDSRVDTELTAGFEGDVKVDTNGEAYYFFEPLKEQLDAGAAARQAAAGQVVFGQTVFSSDEEEKSLDQSELEDFDERLARELGGTELDFEVGAAATQSVGVN